MQDGAPPLQVATSAAAKATTSAAAKKGGGGGKAGEESVQLESEWIAEHGCQVARMLPGGECAASGPVPSLALHFARSPPAGQRCIALASRTLHLAQPRSASAAHAIATYTAWTD